MVRPKIPLACLLLVLFPSALHAARTKQIASYDIEVRLVPEDHKLVGREIVRWVNTSDDTIPDVWFHLYMNAFKNENSTFMKESGGRHRGFGKAEDDAEKWGYIDIVRIRRLGGEEEKNAAEEGTPDEEGTPPSEEDLRSRMTFEHPDDLNEKDQTVARIVLPEPIPPHGTLELEIEFETVMPKIFARTGYEREFYMVGQWFPKIGVYLPAGHRGVSHGRWNCHQFHANTEFFADYGTYHVEITVPERFVVGATGRLVGTRPAGQEGEVTHVYEQEDVHDFAWTAYPRYRVHREKFPRPETQRRTYGDEPPLSEEIEITLLYQPEHEKMVARHLRAVKGALTAFGRFVGTYPYDTITLVDPPYFALGAGGMEYPTLITCGTSYLFTLGMFEEVRITEVVLVHEFGHQYFYGLLGSNEFEEAYLDEGFNSYYEGRVMDEIYGEGRSYGKMFGMDTPSFASAHINYASRPEGDPIAERAWVFSPGMYSRNTYAKTAIVLRNLEKMLGRDTIDAIFQTYFERYRFKHPTGRDFFEVAKEVSGKDLDGYFSETFYDDDTIDYMITMVKSTPLPKAPLGVHDREDGTHFTITAENREEHRVTPESGYYIIERDDDAPYPTVVDRRPVRKALPLKPQAAKAASEEAPPPSGGEEARSASTGEGPSARPARSSAGGGSASSEGTEDRGARGTPGSKSAEETGAISEAAAAGSGEGSGEASGGGEEPPTVYESVVMARRKGTLHFPVEIRILLEDDTIIEEKWDGEGNWIRFRIFSTEKVRLAEIDPEHNVVLDLQYRNNLLRREPVEGVARAWKSFFFAAFNHLLLVLAPFL